jgi:hypothetical protein
MQTGTAQQWNKAKAEVFWGEIAPCEHVVQIYESDHAFLDAFSGFVGGGINAGDSIIVIATANHLAELESRLTSLGIHVKKLISDKRYFPLDAQQTLDKFMVDGWPDEKLFFQSISTILQEAKQKGRRIRAFGEMVALLWAQGLNGATVQLEHLWNELASQEDFSLFCAYPKSGFTADLKDGLHDICCMHSRVINGSDVSMTEVRYKTA